MPDVQELLWERSHIVAFLSRALMALGYQCYRSEVRGDFGKGVVIGRQVTLCLPNETISFGYPESQSELMAFLPFVDGNQVFQEDVDYIHHRAEIMETAEIEGSANINLLHTMNQLQIIEERLAETLETVARLTGSSDGQD